MYKYFEELDKRQNFMSFFALPIDYFTFKEYYDEIFNNSENIEMLKDGTNRIMYNWLDAWYITPNGYLYNTGTDHKEGNLIYAYNNICDTLCQKSKNQIIPTSNVDILDTLDYQKFINDIFRRNYITYEEFVNYSNLKFPFNWMDSDTDVFKIYEQTSSQKSLITLIVGYLAAKSCLYSAFAKINNSNRKKELMLQISEMDIKDILVKFARFNKIETNLDRTITTSSLNGINEFLEYLNRGWNLQIIPGLVYDTTLDKLTEVDFNSPFINKHLDYELNNYSGKGKVLIRHKTF